MIARKLQSLERADEAPELSLELIAVNRESRSFLTVANAYMAVKDYDRAEEMIRQAESVLPAADSKRSADLEERQMMVTQIGLVRETLKKRRAGSP